MVETEGLTHIHLAVRDLDRSLRFYRQVFGMEELFRDGPSMVFLRTAGANDTITLNGDPAAAERAGSSGGIGHFGFRLKGSQSLDDAIAAVEAAGGKLVRRGDHAPDRPFAFVADPDGYLIEF